MTNHLVSAFDINYLPRALVLYESAIKFIPECKLWFLCLDEESLNALRKINLKGLVGMGIDELGLPELADLRKTRNRAEFAFTSKSNFLAYLLNNDRFADGDNVIFADADIMFLASVKELIETIGKHSITRSPHSFPRHKVGLHETVGKYNAGMVFYHIDENSKKAIRGWAKQCIDWCFHRLEDGKFADQMYINNWHNEYKDVYDLPDKGVNLGTWNIGNYKITEGPAGAFKIDGEPLVCYHYHGFKVFEDAHGTLRPLPISVFHTRIYDVYLKALEREYRRVRGVLPDFTGGLMKRPSRLLIIKQTLQRRIRACI